LRSVATTAGTAAAYPTDAARIAAAPSIRFINMTNPSDSLRAPHCQRCRGPDGYVAIEPPVFNLIAALPRK
jgi:hypothetical protein